MSVSEKLRALDKVRSAIERGAVLDEALPQIRALVEAAEPFLAYERWGRTGGMKGHPPHLGPKEIAALCSALAALDEALP